MRLLKIAIVLASFIALAHGYRADAVQYSDKVTGNPLVPGYFADPCCRKFGDTYYLYVTPDGWGVGQGPFCIWTSKDFVHWTSNKSNWPTTDQKWAPSVVYKNGLYYMYTQVPCQVYVATSTSPLGPWTNPVSGGNPLVPTGYADSIVLDGECFIDSDNQAYLYFGCWWTPAVVKLNPDLVSWTDPPIKYFGSPTPYGTVQGCMEAPYMYKRNGVYYYMYSDYQCFDSTYQVEYSTGASPLGPWTYGANNPVLSTSADDSIDGPGHHTMMDDGSNTFIIYHRHDNPHNPDGVHRQVAADLLKFNADNSMQKVTPSHRGVGFLAPSTKKDTNWVVDRSLTVTATASSYAGADWVAANAADENNGTIWKAHGYTYPQWLTIDLGQSKSVKRIETEFEFPQVAYKYRIEYSTDGSTWSTFVNHTTNTDWGPMIDTVGSAVNGRYFRITMTGDDTPGRPNPAIGIWNVKLYDGVDKANAAPWVSAGSNRTCSTAFPTVPLYGTVIDDGQPNGPVTCTWSKVSGSGTVTFADATNPETTATFSAAGTYVLQLLANDGALQGTSQVTYTVTSSPGNQLLGYSFNEAGGTLISDSSSNARDAWLASDNNVKQVPVRGSGAVGKALAFEGARSYVGVPALSTYTSLSMAAWVKLDALPDYSGVICSNGGATGAPQLLIRGTGEVQFSVPGCNPADMKSSFKFTSATLGKWTHIAVTYDKATKKVIFYINGVAEAAQTYTTAQTIALNAGSRIGAWDGGGRYFHGKIDEVNVYNSVLSAANVMALYTASTLKKVSDAKALADGQSITLTNVPITYAPVDAYLNRNTTNFYIEDADTGAGMRVEDGPIGWDTVTQDGGATITGIKRTSTTTGEAYLELSQVPELESGQPVPAVSTTTQSINTDPSLVGKLVNLSCTVSSIAGDRMSMNITDGGTLTAVKCETKAISNAISVGNTISLTGVVSKTGTTPATATIVILAKSINRTNPPMDPMSVDLEVWYKFDETSGNSAIDSSEGNNRTGTLVNNPSRAAGRINNCLNFNGTNQYVTVPSIGPAYPQFSVSAWVNVAALPTGSGWSAASITHTDGWTDGAIHFLLLGPNSGNNASKLQLSIGGFGDIWSNTTWTNLLGKWAHVAITYDRVVGMKMYVNGALESFAGTTAGPVVNLSALKVATWGGGDRFLNGKVDDYRVYSRVLTDAEISGLYTNGLAHYTITASAGPNGSISPSGTTTLVENTSQTYTITPNAGYSIDTLTVDGATVTSTLSYTFSFVSANHTISVTFKADPYADLLAYYKFNETSGTAAADSSGHGYQATTSAGCSWAAGKYSNAVSFNGTVGYVTVPNLGSSVPAFTIAGWLNLHSIPGGTGWNAAALAGTDNWGAGDVILEFIGDGGGSTAGKLQFSINGSFEMYSNTLFNTASGNQNKWVHFAVTYGGSTAKIYINGVQDASAGSSTLAANLSLLKFGSWFGGARFLDGALDDVRIYNRVLSAAEIANMYANTVNITASAGAGGTISPTGTVAVSYGTDQTFTITPNTGYTISQVTIDGVNQGAIGSYTFSAVTVAHTISASFVAQTFTIAASAGTVGTISPNGTTTKSYGTSQAYTITPNAGYAINQVTVDGVNQGAISSYTFNNITANHTISATFTQLTYTVTASAGANGSISPSGVTTKNYGQSQAYTITPNLGYGISELKIDGSKITPVLGYTFSNITANHTISAMFSKILGLSNRGAGQSIAAGKVVKVWGKVKSINGTTSFVISDGFKTTGVTIMNNGVSLPTGFAVGKTALVTGLMGTDKAVQAQSISIYP